MLITEISPLFLAARGGHLELVKALIRYGGDVDQLGAPQKIGPLHWAAHKEHVEIALFLIENGADLLKLDGEGRTPLSMASPELADKMIGECTIMHSFVPALGTFPTCTTERFFKGFASISPPSSVHRE